MDAIDYFLKKIPRHEKKYNKNTSFENVKKLPWILNSKPKLEHEFKKVDQKELLNLGKILC